MIIDVVVGAQWGSEAKGHVACQLARQYDYNLLVRVAGPNAGHTGYDDQGRKYALRQIPVASVVDHNAVVYLGPGSEIDPPVLREEIALLEADGHQIKGRLLVSPQATIIEKEHHLSEESFLPEGTSTRKGVGAARAARLMRQAILVRDFDGELGGARISDIVGRPTQAMIEGTQGFGLGLHAGYYPDCTSSDCRTVDFLAMSGLPTDSMINSWVVARTFPIRIAGNSGPLLNETTWEVLGELTDGHIQPEYTTVTKKIRRVGFFDSDLVRRALEANRMKGSTHLVLSFVDYLWPQIAGAEAGRYKEVQQLVMNWCVGMSIPMPRLVTTSPNSAVWL